MVDFLVAKPKDSAAIHRPGSIFSVLFLDPPAGLDPAVREIAQSRDIAERALFYGQRLSMIISWRVEAVYHQMLTAPQVTAFQGEFSKFNETSGRFTDAATQFAASFDRLPANTEKVLDQFVHTLASSTDTVAQRAAARISAEREAAVVQASERISVERDAAIRQATARISDERDATIHQISADVHAQQEEAVRNMEAALQRSIGRFSGMLIWVAIVAILAFFSAFVVYRLVLRSIARQPGPGDAARIG